MSVLIKTENNCPLVETPEPCDEVSNNTIAWGDYCPQPTKEEVSKQVDVTCPKCGKKLWKRLDMILTSNPPKYVYECHGCGWQGFNY